MTAATLMFILTLLTLPYNNKHTATQLTNFSKTATTARSMPATAHTDSQQPTTPRNAKKPKQTCNTQNKTHTPRATPVTKTSAKLHLPAGPPIETNTVPPTVRYCLRHTPKHPQTGAQHTCRRKPQTGAQTANTGTHSPNTKNRKKQAHGNQNTPFL